jgi:hypothetical protein
MWGRFFFNHNRMVVSCVCQPLPLPSLHPFSALFDRPPAAGEGTPEMLSYQGRITVDSQNFDGIGQFKFA